MSEQWSGMERNGTIDLKRKTDQNKGSRNGEGLFVQVRADEQRRDVGVVLLFVVLEFLCQDREIVELFGQR